MKRMGIGVMVFVFGLLLLAACGEGGSAQVKNNAELFKEAVNNDREAKSYHFETELSQGGVMAKLMGDVDVAGDRYRVEGNAMGFPIGEIKIGNDIYTKAPLTGKWEKKTGTNAGSYESLTKMWDEFKPDEVDNAKDSLKDGVPPTELINGVETKHITGNLQELASVGSSAQGKLTEGSADIWVSTGQNPHVYRMKIKGKSEGKDTEATFSWSKHNEPVTIEAPPVE